MTHAELEKEWIIRIADFKASGQTIPKWCEAQNFKAHQLRYWLNKLEPTKINNQASTEWFSVNVDKQIDESNAPVVISVGAVKIEVKPDFNPDLLIDVVKTLKTLC